MIRPAVQNDIPSVAETYEELHAYEQQHGTSSNWLPGIYPVRQTAEEALKAGTLYVLEDGGSICASMIVNEEQPPEYAGIKWICTAGRALVLHTLCVPPSKAHHGYDSQMMRFADDFARTHGFASIRLDTWTGNKAAAALYKKSGYVCTGSAHALVHNLISEEQLFFEKIITPERR